MPTVTVNATELFYLRRGAGEPLLLIQGMSGNHLHWGESFEARLQDAFELVPFDNRGVGFSGPLTGAFSIADLADDAAGVLDALDLPSAHVMGVSMGGMVAQELALRHPGRVRTLTLGCTTPGGPGSVPTDPAVVTAMAAAAMSGDREHAMEVAWTYNVSASFAANAEAKAAIRATLTEAPASLPVLLAQLQAIAGHDTLDRLHEITAPTLVVHGAADRMLPVGNATLIAERIAGSRLEILDGIGHVFWWERPELAADFVRDLAGVRIRG